MLSNQFLLDVAPEIVVDLFAGGGGASTGIELALGRHVDVAVNHDPEAVAMHTANHPQTKHHVCDVFEVDPLAVADGRPIGLLWASPDCKHHSKAKGGKPVDKKIRGLAWIVVKWAKLVKPRIIMLENVEEFQHWGPLDENNLPCKYRKGRTFKRWKTSLENLGYKVDFREDRACDFGTPTIRKRLFLIARCDGQPIVFPERTHADPASLPAKAKKLKPYRTAAECIDWSIPAPSIFERTRELAEATKRRIAKGIHRYVVDNPKPFIVPLTHQGGDRVEPLHEPFRTITGANRGERAIVAPTLIAVDNKGARTASWRATDPLRTTTVENRHALVTAFLAQHNNHRGTVPSDGRAVDAPISTVTTKGCQQQLVTAHLTKFHEGSTGSELDRPVPTVTSNGHNPKRPGGAAPLGLVTGNLIKLRGTSTAAGLDEPLHTVSAQGWHHAEVRAFLIKYFGTDQDPRLDEPMHTATTKARFGLVTVQGEDYAIVDIGLRMLSPRELFRAQGFDDSYIIDWGIHPATGDVIELTKTAQVRMCGNSVCPQVAEAYVRANYLEPQLQRRAA